jgi:magnesium transporter
MGVCTARVHGATGGTQRVIDPHEISDLLPNDGNVIWLDIQDPTLGDLELLRREFGFHELALEDVAKQHQRAKVDQYDGYYFVVFYAVEPDTLREVNLFIGENYVVTIHRGELPAISETVERWQQNRDKLQHGIGLLVYSLMDAIVDGYFPVVDGIAERVDEIEQEIFRRASRESLEDVFALKKRLLSLRRILVPERDVMNVLARRDQPIFGEEVTVYFQDVYDHLGGERRPVPRPTVEYAGRLSIDGFEPTERDDEADDGVRDDPDERDAGREHLRHEFRVYA